MNNLKTFCIPILLILFSYVSYAQGEGGIELNYIVDGKVKRIKSNSKVVMTQDGNSFELKLCCNKIFLPLGFDKDKSVDILFVINKKELFFASISSKKLLNDQKVIWELGYYKRINEKAKEEFYLVEDFSKLKELYYWKFRPQEFGDGTIILVTIPKN
jgi:hypothetical protein